MSLCTTEYVGPHAGEVVVAWTDDCGGGSSVTKDRKLQVGPDNAAHLLEQVGNWKLVSGKPSAPKPAPEAEAVDDAAGEE